MLMERSRSPYYVLGLSRRLPVSPGNATRRLSCLFCPGRTRGSEEDAHRLVDAATQHAFFVPRRRCRCALRHGRPRVVGSRQRCQDPGRGGSVLPHRRPGGAAKVQWAIPPALVSSISQMGRLRLSCPETLGSTGGFTQDGVKPWARRPGPVAPPEGPFPAPERWP